MMHKACFFLFAALLGVQGGASAKVDIVGYYGNSGNAVSSIPTLDAIHPNYNIIILTFAAISDSGQWTLDIQGPYAGNPDQLAADVLVWKAQVDPWDRQRAVLVSIGGQNGRWPSGVSEESLLSGLWTFMAQYNLDGLDVDLEGADAAAAATLPDVITNLTSSNKLVTAAPEAAQYALDAYALILPLMSWVHPQFYNNGPNAVTIPYLPPAELWPTPWTVESWQEEVAGVTGEAFWGGVLDAIADADGLEDHQKGMLVPASTIAAGSYNDWAMEKLAVEVAYFNVTHVGTWSVAYDLLTDWAFASAIGALND